MIFHCQKRFFLTGAFLLLSTLSVFSQIYNYYHLTINDGLPSNKVSAITQDPDGFMYFATKDGLVKYDGERMKVITHSPSDTSSIPRNSIKGLLRGSKGEIWCTHDKYGLSALHPGTGRFRRFEFKKITANRQFAGYINNLHEGPDGKIYACTFGDGQSVFIIDPATGAMRQFFLNDYDPGHLLNKNALQVINLHFYNDTLWLFGTTQGLVLFNPVKKSVRKLLQVVPDSLENWANFFDGFLPAADGSLYMGTWGSGLYRYHPSTQKLESFKKVSNWVDLSACSPQLFVNDSTILVTGWDAFLFNIHTGEITCEKQDLLNKYAISGKANSAYRSADGTIWLSTLSGVNYFHPAKNDFKTIYFAGETERLKIDPKREQFWIWYDPATHLYVINYYLHKETKRRFILSVYDDHFRHLYDLPHPLTNENTILSVTGDLKGKVFFSGTLGDKSAISMLDLRSVHPAPVIIAKADIDALWINKLSVFGDTLIVTDLLHSRLAGYHTSDHKLLFNKTLTWQQKKRYHYKDAAIVEDRRRNCLWALDTQGPFAISLSDATAGKVLAGRLDELTDNKPSCYAITLDDKDQLWISHSGGITSLHPDSNIVLTHFNEGQLPSVNSLQLFYDSSGFIWSDCSKGLLRLDVNTGLVQLFNSDKGLQPQCYPGTSSMPANGKMIIPFAGGLLWYDTRKQEELPVPRPPLIIAISSRNDAEVPSTTVFKDTLLMRPYDKNNITIAYSSMNYRRSAFMRYACKLDGIDPDFNPTTAASISYTGLPPGKYLFHVKSSTDGKHWSEERQLTIIITPPWYQTWWFRIILGLILTGILTGIYRMRIRQVKKDERLRSEFHRQITEMEMTALRSQMNPHFIFNSLNSINRYVMQNDRLTASEYIAKFGKLMRNVLDNSKYKSISLQQELETLELYLELEKLRFEDKFEYRVHIDEEVDISSIQIPPMLLQPFAENSIWHGLMHKQEKGLLLIKVSMLPDGILEITIEDDGIGRAKATELRSKKNTRHSHGMQLTTDRIRLLNELYRQENRIIVNDLIADDGTAAGTRVKLQIQLKKEKYDQSAAN